jgi:hypothetical protein
VIESRSRAQVCPHCGADNPPEAVLCAHCGGSLVEAPRRPAIPLPPIPGSEAPQQEEPAEPPVVDRPLVVPVSSGETEPADADSQPTVSSGASEPADPDGPDPIVDPEHLEVLAQFRKKKPIISVIGFAKSGKTFLVNRLLDALRREGGWKSYPPPAERIGRSPEGLEPLAYLTPTSRSWADHSGYVLADCAGESLRQAVSQHRDIRSFEGSAARSFLLSLGLASAHVLVLTAEDVAGRGEAVRELENNFHDLIGALVLCSEALAGRSLDDAEAEAFLRRGLSRNDLAGVFERGHLRVTSPLAVVFAQADRLSALDPDPYLLARRRMPTLFHAIESSFDHYRFDFLSAFEGFEPNDPLEPEVHYHLPHRGVLPLFDWLHRLIAPRSGPFATVRRWLDGGLPTRHAVALRKLVDPELRRAGAGDAGGPPR